MEKVKVTKKIAELIKNSQKKYENHEIVASYNYISDKVKKTLDLDTLIKALYIGYEVEPEFEVGDWVVSTEFRVVKRIEKIEKPEGQATIYRLEDNFNVYTIRHATPEEIKQEKERRIWKKLGRQPYEFKARDIVTYKVKKGLFEIVSHEGEMHRITRTFCGSEFLALTKNLKLVCPVENRLDVSVDE